MNTITPRANTPNAVGIIPIRYIIAASKKHTPAINSIARKSIQKLSNTLAFGTKSPALNNTTVLFEESVINRTI